MAANQKEIEARLLLIVREFLHELEAERALRAVTIDASLERDLGIDSLGKVELLHRIEKIFSIRVPENAMVEVESLRDLIKLIEQSSLISLPVMQTREFAPVLEATSLNLATAKTLLEVLSTRASKESQRIHVYLQKEQGEEQIIRYGQLFEKATAIAKGLQQRGIQPGEAIAIMLPTSESFFYAFCGVLLAGAIPVPIYPPFRPDRIEEYAKREGKILRNAEVRILITFAQAETLSKLLRTFIPSLKEVSKINNLQMTEGTLRDILVNENDHALIQYTSGSTGDPKGVLLTHANILANIRAIGQVIPIQPTDTGVSWLPLYHDMGLMSWLGSLYFGIPVTILSPMTFLTRPEQWLWAIHFHRATISGGPNFAYELCIKKIDSKDIEGLDLSSWRFAFNGAEAVNPRTMERFYKKFSPFGFKMEAFAPVYGLAEATVGLTFPIEKRVPWIEKIERDAFQKENKALPATQNVFEFVACGEALPEHEFRIVNDTGNEVSERMIGNIQFKGPSAMQGYFNNITATQKAYHEGWWDTGDLGYRVNKELFITGRKKDLIIRAGRNLYPEEVEDIVSQITGVRKGCVVAFGVSDPGTGTEKLIVVAETYQQEEKNRQQIYADILEKLAIDLGTPPDQVILVPPRTIPKTSSGKLQRSRAKQTYLEGKLTAHHLPAKIQLAKLTFISVFKKISRSLTYFGKIIYSGYVVAMLLITVPFVWISIFIFPCKIAAKLCRVWARNILRMVFCPITLIGKEKIPKNRSVIFVANHTSYVDSIVLLGVLPTDALFIAKKELLQTPIIRSFIKKLGYLTVDRLDFVKSIADTKRIEECVRKGNSIIIFPEGTFTYATGLRPFKLGAFNLAVETGLPICPVAIHGSRSILRGNNLLLKPGAIKITIGTLLQPRGKNWNEVVRLHSLVRAEIAKHCGEPAIDIVVAGPS